MTSTNSRTRESDLESVEDLAAPLPSWTGAPGVDPYGSRMLPGLGIVLRFFSHFFFRHIRDDTDLGPIREAARKGTVVYVMRTRSRLDYLFFNYFALKHGLPLARFANDVRTESLGPLTTQVRAAWARRRYRQDTGGPLPDPVDSGYLRRVVARGHTALVFLRGGRRWPLRTVTPTKDLVEELLEAQGDRDRPVFLVPQVLVWSRGPDRSTRGLLDLLLGGRDDPGRLRKATHFVLNFRHAVVRVGEPVSVQDFLLEQEGASRERVAKKLRWLLLGYLYRERKVVKGPDVRPRRWIFERILAEPDVRTAIETTARSEGRSVDAIEQRAARILDKMGADYRWGAILVLRVVIDFITSRLYSGVEFSPADAERIRSAARRGTVLLVPSHRSHLDYLLLSWLLYYQGMMPPHIAAGQNMAFWPVSNLFRRAGAYFIRRSFSGDPLYSALVSHYIRSLISEGYTQEFFIEGTRSRTGKMLPGKIGLLATYMEAMADRIVPDILVVPVYIAYERVVEDYATELTGGAKKKESARGLVRGASALRRRFGRVYAKTNEPISLKEALELLDRPYRELSAEERKTFLKRVGQHLAAEIQDVTVVTPSSVCATALMTHERRGMTRDLFHQRARFLTRWLEARGAHFSDSWHFPEDALDEALELFVSSGVVQVVPSSGATAARGQDILAIDSEVGSRLNLDYYKNTVLFHFVPAAFFCTALQLGTRDEEPLPLLQRRFDFLLDLFQQEFVFHPDVPADHLVDRAVAQLAEHGVVDVRDVESPGEAGLPDAWVDQGVSATGTVRLVKLVDLDRADLLLAMIRSLLESYYVVLKGCVVLRGGPMTESELVGETLLVGQRMYLCEDVTRPEAASKVPLTNAVRHFRAKGVLVALDSGGGRDTRLALDEDVRQRYMAPISKLFRADRLQSVEAE
ncbi:MAG TPA: hypothetical protein DIU15_15500 [Deltaproteobacteria bacterium]|nr:hypothetical protein [Deltaproteobacteria bacterium]HCP47446.1 hypothetical protein [Deltaproteobacteria bacterium]